MIGRAAVGRPWLIGEIAAGLDGRAWRRPTYAQRANAARAHYETLLDIFGARQGVRHARKHLAAYADHAAADGAGLPEGLRARLLTTDDAGEAAALLARTFAPLAEMAA